MENKKNNQGIIILLTTIIIMLSILCILFATETISLKNNNTNKDNIENSETNNNINKINIKVLSLDEVKIFKDSPNHHLSINGTMELSFNQDNFLSVSLIGNCIGSNNEKYIMTGTGSGMLTYKDGDTKFNLVNTINNQDGDVIYPDGTTKKSSEMDWNNVKIKSCTVEKMIAYPSESNGNTQIITNLNFKKEFK